MYNLYLTTSLEGLKDETILTELSSLEELRAYLYNLLKGFNLPFTIYYNFLGTFIELKDHTVYFCVLDVSPEQLFGGLMNV